MVHSHRRTRRGRGQGQEDGQVQRGQGQQGQDGQGERVDPVAVPEPVGEPYAEFYEIDPVTGRALVRCHMCEEIQVFNSTGKAMARRSRRPRVPSPLLRCASPAGEGGRGQEAKGKGGGYGRGW